MEASLCNGWMKGVRLGLAREWYHTTTMPDVDRQIIAIFIRIVVRVSLWCPFYILITYPKKKRNFGQRIAPLTNQVMH